MGFLDIGPGWIAMMCALYYINPMGCFWPFCAAIACHEFGHAAAMLCLRIPLKQFRLNIGGAVLETGAMDYRREIICALAGPAANLLLIPLGRWYPMFATLCLCLAVFNLLPFLPLDGGHALQAALLLRMEAQQVFRIMTAAALICGLALAAFALWVSIGLDGGLWPMLVAALTLLRIGFGVCEEQKNQL